jgi:hypothetical protein
MADVSTDPAELLTAAADWLKLSPHQLLACRAYTLATMASLSTDPAVLLAAAESAGFTKLSDQQLKAIGDYVAVEFNNAGGAGGGDTAHVSSSGSGSPEGVVTRSPGAKYWDATNQVEYVKDTGTGNTGWIVTVALGT